jgi:hypothetical protein
VTGGHRELDVTGRFHALLERLRPALAEVGFGPSATSFAAELRDGILRLLDITVAPWSTDEKICFTVSWGVHVPGMEEALGDPAPEVLDVESCLLGGRVGEHAGGLDPRWFTVAARPRLVASVADANLAKQVWGSIVHEALPRLDELATIADVQAHLHDGLLTGRGVPHGTELWTIRRIAALSVLLGDRDNAVRWLDHLEARSATAMAPDVVAERIAPLRQRIAS